MGILISKPKSKEELLCEKCIEGDIEGIKSLSLQGADLEYVDQQGKTPLIAACLSSERYALAKTLIELGANVNAYDRGRYAGTSLHHAAERGLDRTVKLLLSHGANPFLRNGYCQTPLDVARTRGFTNVARLIESRICFFSGWLMEFYGPGFLEVFAPKLLSTKIWVVVIPHALPNPAKPPELELVIYSNFKDAHPRAVVPLWKGDIEEPKLRLQVLTLMIFDKPTGTRYKFAASNDGDKQQIQSFYLACRGTSQVTQASAPTGSTEAAEEPAEEALAINASLQSAAENRLPPHPNHNTQNSGNLNSWEISANNNSHNGLGPASESSPPETSSNGWTDEPPKEQNNGWALSTPKPNHSTQTSRSDTSNVWANSVNTNVARLIESPICFFSGWLMEFYGPGFLEVFAPKLLSTKIWVVVIPHALPNPAKPLELEMVIYSNFQDAQPRAVVPLWKGDIEEPKLRLQVLTLMIFDKPTGTRYKFAASNDGDKQQIQSFYLACRGTPQVTQASAPTGSTEETEEPAEEALAINASLQSAAENRLPPPPNHNTQNSGNLNSWETSANNNSHNGWGPASESSPPETSSNGWTDEPPKEQNNGWALSTPKPNHSTQTSRPDTSNVWANSVNTNVARLIESPICFFSGWLMEFYGPGFLEVFAPKLLSTKIWVVVIPHALPNPAKPLELEMVIYSNFQDAQPRAVVPLWKGDIEEPKLRLQVLTLMIFDKPAGTRYKFAASNDGDKQQIQSFYLACRGTPQVTQASAPTGSTEATEEPAEEALAINASLQSAAENRLPPPPNHNTQNSGNLNSWETSANNNSHNGWGPASESSPPETSSNGWTDEPPKEQNNGWALSTPKSNHSTQTSRPDTSNVWENSVNNPTQNGWVSATESSPSKASSCGLIDEPTHERYNGWELPDPKLDKNTVQANITRAPAKSSGCPIAENNIEDNTEVTYMSHSHYVPSAPPIPMEGLDGGPIAENNIEDNTEVTYMSHSHYVPSVPPIPMEGLDGVPIHYPSIDFSHVDFSVPSFENEKVGSSSQVKDEDSSCVICLDAPVEGACVPCGHMAGCMACLNEIKTKKGHCPVCRAKITQVIRLYAV